MLTIKQIKREIKYIDYINLIFKKSEERNSLITLFLCFSFSIVSATIVFILTNWLFAIGVFAQVFLLVFSICLILMREKQSKKIKDKEINIFLKLNKKEKKLMNKTYNKLSEFTKKYIKENKLDEYIIYDLYTNSLKNKKIIDILKDLEEIIEDLNNNKRMNLKCYLFNYIFSEINKEEFNIYKDEIIQYIEKEFYNEDVIYFLEKMKELKLKYDDEEINKYKNQLKKDISTNKIKKENKLIQSI